MSHKYELTIVLDTRGKEESIDKILGQIGKEIEAEGARLEQIDQLGRKKFAYNPRKVDEGFYANFHFEAEPAAGLILPPASLSPRANRPRRGLLLDFSRLTEPTPV
jgi:small subunit ribosomal protein S6